MPTDSDEARIVALAGLGVGLALLGNGKVIGRGDAGTAVAPAQPVGLARSRFQVGSNTFTVLDDSAARGDGRRCSVVARDGHGAVGLLYIGFGPEGAVCEARIDGDEWRSAELIE